MDIGYRYKLIGSSDIMSRVFHEVRNAIILAVILIYMVLAAEFESFTQPFVIMMSLPLPLSAPSSASSQQTRQPT